MRVKFGTVCVSKGEIYLQTDTEVTGTYTEIVTVHIVTKSCLMDNIPNLHHYCYYSSKIFFQKIKCKVVFIPL